MICIKHCLSLLLIGNFTLYCVVDQSKPQITGLAKFDSKLSAIQSSGKGITSPNAVNYVDSLNFFIQQVKGGTALTAQQTQVIADFVKTIQNISVPLGPQEQSLLTTLNTIITPYVNQYSLQQAPITTKPFIAYYNQIQTGQALTPAQVSDFNNAVVAPFEKNNIFVTGEEQKDIQKLFEDNQRIETAILDSGVVNKLAQETAAVNF